MQQNGLREKNHSDLITILVLLAALVSLFFYLDRQNQLSALIRTSGWGGIFLSILLMAALCITPIPSEGLVLLLLKIFGVLEGVLYSWLGSILGSMIIFYLARHSGRGFCNKLITPDRFHQVDQWLKKKGSFGLLFARLLPIPAFAVNYIAGIMPSINFAAYLWTAAISIIPYYVGVALVYLGVVKSTWISLAIGVVILLVLWGISYVLNQKSTQA